MLSFGAIKFYKEAGQAIYSRYTSKDFMPRFDIGQIPAFVIIPEFNIPILNSVSIMLSQAQDADHEEVIERLTHQVYRDINNSPMVVYDGAAIYNTCIPDKVYRLIVQFSFNEYGAVLNYVSDCFVMISDTVDFVKVSFTGQPFYLNRYVLPIENILFYSYFLAAPKGFYFKHEALASKKSYGEDAHFIASVNYDSFRVYADRSGATFLKSLPAYEVNGDVFFSLNSQVKQMTSIQVAKENGLLRDSIIDFKVDFIAGNVIRSKH